MEHICFLLRARTRDYFDYIPVLKYVVLTEPLFRARVDSVDKPTSDIRMNLEGKILGIFTFLNQKGIGQDSPFLVRPLVLVFYGIYDDVSENIEHCLV
jgi:hypothetical protein